MQTHAEEMPEGEEPPPPGVKLMAGVRWMLIAGLALAAVYAFTLWRGEPSPQAAHEHAELWQCPMHPQVTSDTPGECPVCHMDLVKVEQTKAAKERWQCPMHPQVTSDTPGECPVCHMDLVKVEQSKPVKELWQCPMHPQVTSDAPGECPVCHMDLVKVEQGSHAGHGGHEAVPELATISLPEERVQKIGVRTETARKVAVDDTVRAVGILAANEARTVRVHARFSGWIEELHVRETGATVSKGQALARIYSPEVLQAQQEFLSAITNKSGDVLVQRLQKAAEDRLRLMEVDPAPLLEEGARATGQVTIRAPQSGFITQKAAVQGVYISPGTALFEISDLSVVWLLVDIRENELSRVQVGQKAVVRFPAYPDLRMDGRVSYLYPSLDPATRTLKARIELKNPGRKLRPGLYGDAELAMKGAPAVVVPSEAVVQTGKHAYAFVTKEPGVFEPRKVEVGLRAGDLVQVRSGIQEGEEVVTSGIFLIDSESRLRATINRASGEPVTVDADAHRGHR